MQDYQRYPLGDFPLQSGGVLQQGELAYTTYGTLNAAADNAILVPGYYTGTHRSYRSLIAPGRALDPTHYFIVLTNLFGNGLSSSPSHAGPQQGADFPTISIADNVGAQARLADALGVQCFALVSGWSMGAMQAWQWAVSYPQRVKALLPICGTARCWPLNFVFLQGVKAALQADPLFAAGRYHTAPLAGLAAFGRNYAGWAYSAEFFRDALYRNLGFDSLEALLLAWEQDHQQWDANDLLAMLATWQSGAIDFTALRQITASTLVMAGSSDSYFTEQEARLEFEQLRCERAQWQPLQSPYGHCAGAPDRFVQETAQIEAAIRQLLT